eukprot:19184_1
MIRSTCCHEWFIIITGISTALTHIFFSDIPAITYPPGVLFVGSAFLWYYYEVNFKSLKQVIVSFRGFVILSMVIVICICDIIRVILSKHHTLMWSILILDICTWSTAIIILISVDSVNHPSNFMRFLAPFVACSIGIHSLFDCLDDDNPILFTLKYGIITVTQIEMTATVELIIFLFTLMFSVPRDWNHRYYSILNKKLERKQLLPFK